MAELTPEQVIAEGLRGARHHLDLLRTRLLDVEKENDALHEQLRHLQHGRNRWIESGQAALRREKKALQDATALREQRVVFTAEHRAQRDALREQLRDAKGLLDKRYFELSKADEQLREAREFTYCAYCNERFSVDGADATDAVERHIFACEKHPIRRLTATLREIRDTGKSDANSLVHREIALRALAEMGMPEPVAGAEDEVPAEFEAIEGAPGYYRRWEEQESEDLMAIYSLWKGHPETGLSVRVVGTHLYSLEAVRDQALAEMGGSDG